MARRPPIRPTGATVRSHQRPVSPSAAHTSLRQHAPTPSSDLRGIHPADAPTRGIDPDDPLARGTDPDDAPAPRTDPDDAPTRVTLLDDADVRALKESSEPAPGFQLNKEPLHAPPGQRRRRRWPVALVLVIGLLVAGFFGYQNREALQAAIPSLGGQPAPSQTPKLTPSPAQSPRATTVSKPVGSVGALAKGLVLISTTVPGGGTAAGTGMVLTPDGRVLTNYHVVRGSDVITVTVATTGKKFTADVVGHDYSRDVAVLQISGAKGLETVVLDKDPVKVNDQVTAVGNTQGRGTLTATTGTVKALDQTITIEGESGDASAKISGMIVSTVAAEPGDSGGPTYDSEGEVIGITSAGASTNDQSRPSGTTDGSDPLTFTIPIATAMSVVDQVLSGKQTDTVRIGPNGFLGVSVGKVSAGLGVVTVTPGSPAEKAGLASDDVINSVNGTTTKTPADLTKIMQATDPGDKLVITWIAGDGSGTRTETVTLVESPWN